MKRFLLLLPLMAALLALIPAPGLARADCHTFCAPGPTFVPYVPPVVVVPYVPPVTTIVAVTPVPYAFLQFVAQPTLLAPVAIAPAVGAAAPAVGAAGSPVPSVAPAVAPLSPATQPATQPTAVSDAEARLARMEAALERLAQTRTEQPSPGDGPPVIRRGKSPATPPAAGPAGAPQTRQPAGSVSTAAVASLLQTRCAQCHTAPGRENVDLFDSAGQFSPNVSRAEIYRAVRSGKMPKSPNKLATEEVALLKQWADEER